MEKQTVYIGSYRVLSSGYTQDYRRPVEFEGEQVCSHTDIIDDGTRGITETLYRTADGRLVVHIKDWSDWQGEPNHYRLVQVSESELQPGGRFEFLGREAGYARPLTLDEALDESGPEVP